MTKRLVGGDASGNVGSGARKKGKVIVFFVWGKSVLATDAAGTNGELPS